VKAYQVHTQPLNISASETRDVLRFAVSLTVRDSVDSMPVLANDYLPNIENDLPFGSSQTQSSGQARSDVGPELELFGIPQLPSQLSHDSTTYDESVSQPIILQTEGSATLHPVVHTSINSSSASQSIDGAMKLGQNEMDGSVNVDLFLPLSDYQVQQLSEGTNTYPLFLDPRFNLSLEDLSTVSGQVDFPQWFSLPSGTLEIPQESSAIPRDLAPPTQLSNSLEIPPTAKRVQARRYSLTKIKV